MNEFKMLIEKVKNGTASDDEKISLLETMKEAMEAFKVLFKELK